MEWEWIDKKKHYRFVFLENEKLSNTDRKKGSCSMDIWSVLGQKDWQKDYLTIMIKIPKHKSVVSKK